MGTKFHQGSLRVRSTILLQGVVRYVIVPDVLRRQYGEMGGKGARTTLGGVVPRDGEG